MQGTLVACLVLCVHHVAYVCCSRTVQEVHTQLPFVDDLSKVASFRDDKTLAVVRYSGDDKKLQTCVLYDLE